MEGQEEKYAVYMESVMIELLDMVRDKTLDVRGRLGAAHKMDQINDSLKLKELMGRAIDQHGEQHHDVMDQVNRLKKKREPWQDNEN
jgi:hypothetical protein